MSLSSIVSPEGFTSNSQLMMEKALDFLWAKQGAHLDNIVNAETPGYKVKTVTFEETLQQKLELVGSNSSGANASYRTILSDSDWYVMEDGETTRMDENGVNIGEQMVELSRTAYQLQYTMQAIKNNFTILGKAING